MLPGLFWGMDWAKFLEGWEALFWGPFLGRPFGSPNAIRGWISFDIL